MAILPHLGSVTARSAVVAFALLGGAVLLLSRSIQSPPQLAAASNVGRVDLDQDGLTDLQELVLGTLPDQPDTDLDGFSDLEERARSSDPLDDTSRPQTTAFAVGTCASADLGLVSLVSAVYVQGGDLDSVDLQVGIVLDGHPIAISPAHFSMVRGFLFAGSGSTDRLAVVELAIPETIVRRLGQLNLFSIVRSLGPGAPSPAVSVISLADMGGVTVSVEPRSSSVAPPGGGSAPQGVIYRPLGGDDSIPATWSGGEVCWQRTSAVGMNGVSVVHEIESADCQPMDTYCSGADCAASVGKPLELPDPGALIGG
jgi:hypothetical protein